MSIPAGFSGFTPGPWFAAPWMTRTSIGICTAEKGAYANRVAECIYWTPGAKGQPDRAAAEANAQLIAAAPTLLAQRDALLEALEEILDNVGALTNVSEFPNCLNISMGRGEEILALCALVREGRMG